MLQQRLAINRVGYLTPPDGDYQQPVNNNEDFTVSKQNYLSLKETIKHTLLTLGLSKKSADETSLDPVFKSIKHLERLLGDYVIQLNEKLKLDNFVKLKILKILLLFPQKNLTPHHQVLVR